MKVISVSVLALALFVLANGHAISEQKVVKYYGERGHIGEKGPEHHEEYAPAYPAYEFSYKVDDPHTHDKKGQEESRHGDEVKGQYWLIQPDGIKRTVTYHANKHEGFKAHVEYSHPENKIPEYPEDKVKIEEHKDKHKSIIDIKIRHEHKPKHHHAEHVPHIEHKHVMLHETHHDYHNEHQPIVVMDHH